jgi:hypothetical protein
MMGPTAFGFDAARHNPRYRYTAYKRASIFECSLSDAASINPIAVGPLPAADAIDPFNTPAAGNGAKPAFAVAIERLLKRRTAPVKSTDGFRRDAGIERKTGPGSKTGRWLNGKNAPEAGIRRRRNEPVF